MIQRTTHQWGTAQRRGWILAALMALPMLTGPLVPGALGAPATDPSPEDLLRQMSGVLKDAKSFTFHAEIDFDRVIANGQKIQYAGAVDMAVRRPDGIEVDYRDDLSAKRFWYDGKNGTLLDLDANKYSTVALPGTIDAAVDALQARYGLTLPLADLVSSDLLARIESKATAWGYIGVGDVEGTPTHHIAIVGDHADLQLWIQKEGKALPLKAVVTYKTMPMAPQYEAVLMDWKLDADIAADRFTPHLPKDAQKIEFLPAEGRK